MKTGVISYSFSQMMRLAGADYRKICELAASLGYEYMDFIDLDPALAHAATELDAAAEVKKICDSLGLGIGCYAVSADLLNRDPAEETARLKGKADIAAALGASFLRHDVTFTPKTPGRPTRWQETVAYTAPLIRDVAAYAATVGIRTCTENHGQFLQDCERMETLIRTVDHENYGWLVDVGNFLCTDQDCLRAVSIAAPYAFHVHLKDFLFKPGTQPSPGDGWFTSRAGNHLRGTVIGSGIVPIPQCIRILQKSEYAGGFTVEFEGMEENTLALTAAMHYLKNIQ